MKVYVNTYAKYNLTNHNGIDLDPEDFSDKDEFLEACQEFHGEGEHEFMFQDHEDIPAKYINESFISDGLWDEFIPLDDAEREICQLYWDNTDDGVSPRDVMDKYQGRHDNMEDFAQELIEDCYDLSKMGNLANYIDYEKFGRDLRYDYDVIEENGYVYIFDS